MAIRIPVDADPNLRDAFLDIEEELDFLKTPQDRDDPLPTEVVALQDQVRLLQSQMNQLDLFRDSEGADADTKDGNPERVLHEDGLFKMPLDGVINAAPPGLGNERADVTGGTRGGHPSQVTNLHGSLAIAPGSLSAYAVRVRDLVATNNITVGGVDPAAYGASVHLTTGETISNNSATLIPWDAEDFDNGGFWTSGAADRFTIPIDGLYLVGESIRWDTFTGAADRVSNGLQHSDATNLTLNEQSTTDAANFGATSAWVGNLNTDEYVRVRVFQNAGGNEVVRSQESRFWIKRLGVKL